MTPNQPSGMTPKNPEPRQGLFGRIWARWQRIQRPAPVTPYSPGLSALVDPFLATEAVSEADRPAPWPRPSAPGSSWTASAP